MVSLSYSRSLASTLLIDIEEFCSHFLFVLLTYHDIFERLSGVISESILVSRARKSTFDDALNVRSI